MHIKWSERIKKKKNEGNKGKQVLIFEYPNLRGRVIK